MTEADVLAEFDAFLDAFLPRDYDGSWFEIGKIQSEYTLTSKSTLKLPPGCVQHLCGGSAVSSRAAPAPAVRSLHGAAATPRANSLRHLLIMPDQIDAVTTRHMSAAAPLLGVSLLLEEPRYLLRLAARPTSSARNSCASLSSAQPLAAPFSSLRACARS